MSRSFESLFFFFFFYIFLSSSHQGKLPLLLSRMNEVAKVFLATNSDYKYTVVSTRAVVMATVGGFQRSGGIKTHTAPHKCSAARGSLVTHSENQVVVKAVMLSHLTVP